MSDRYAAIQAHRPQFPVRLMCAVLDVSVSGFYDAVARQAGAPADRSAHAVADDRLRLHVRAAHHKSRQRYGAPRVHEELKAAGIPVARKRVARLMREDGLVGRRRRKCVRTTDSDHAEPIAPNLLARRFNLAAYPMPDRAWVSDLTYVPTRTGWLFLAVLLDLATRRVVGWATGTTLATTLPRTALERALRTRRPALGLICHSDRGCQYASQEYRAVLAAHGCVQSMSRKGDCWDNAVAESFFATLEHELLADADFTGPREAHVAVAAFIDEWYNPERRHSTLGYVSPIAYEQQLRRADRPAIAA
jgi:transposase InsO family protein